MDACVNEKVKPLSQLWRLRSVLDALPLAYARNNNATVKIHPSDSEVSYFGWYIHRSLLSVFQSAVEEVNRRNVQSMVSRMPIDPVNPILVIVVKRENIVDHTLNQIMKCGPYDLKKPLKVIGSFSNLAIILNDKDNLRTIMTKLWQDLRMREFVTNAKGLNATSGFEVVRSARSDVIFVKHGSLKNVDDREDNVYMLHWLFRSCRLPWVSRMCNIICTCGSRCCELQRVF